MSAFHIQILYTLFMYLAYDLPFIPYVSMLLWVFMLQCVGKQVLGQKNKIWSEFYLKSAQLKFIRRSTSLTRRADLRT